MADLWLVRVGETFGYRSTFMESVSDVMAAWKVEEAEPGFKVTIERVATEEEDTDG